MNMKTAEKSIRRRVIEDEKRIQRIIEKAQKERKEYFGLKFRLVGVLNMFEIIPDFVIPIFTCVQDDSDEINKEYYFQIVNDEKDKLISFAKLNDYGKNQVIHLFNRKIEELFDIHSEPIYAFQYSENQIFWGKYIEVKEFLEKYKTEDSILKEEIQDFLTLERQNIWERLRTLLEENFLNDSEKEIEMKLKTLRNLDSEFEGKPLELYVPEFHGAILRVGIRVKGENKKAYYVTEIGKKLEHMLKD